MKLLLTVLATLMLLHVAHSLPNHDMVESRIEDIEEKLSQMKASSQSDHNEEMIAVVKERVRRLKAYNLGTMQLLQHIHPQASLQSHASHDPTYYERVHLDTIDGIYGHTLQLFE